jgi:mono/diheme cytochrome c family protein
MRLSRTDRRLLVLLIVTLTASWVLWPDVARRNWVYAPDMARSPAVAAFEDSNILPERQALRAPVPGTVPRGQLPLPYAATSEDAVRAGVELANPFAAAVPATQVRGETVFRTFCQPCHGAEGRGDGLVVQRGLPAPPSLMTQRVRDMKDGQIFHIISYGQNTMSPYAVQMVQDDRWRAIVYLRSVQARLPVDPPPTTPLAAGTGAAP